MIDLEIPPSWDTVPVAPVRRFPPNATLHFLVELKEVQ